MGSFAAILAPCRFFGQHGYRVIAHDRRGHGRSTQAWEGNDMDTYADDLAALTAADHIRRSRLNNACQLFVCFRRAKSDFY
jgi:pimeloyl-ACP methyl ester carboxylesterase